MYEDLKGDFSSYVKEWYTQVVENSNYYKDSDFVFSVTQVTAGTYFDGKHGDESIEPYWCLRWSGVTMPESREIVQFFNSEEELYIWGCNFIATQLRKIRKQDLSQE